MCVPKKSEVFLIWREFVNLWICCCFVAIIAEVRGFAVSLVVVCELRFEECSSPFRGRYNKSGFGYLGKISWVIHLIPVNSSNCCEFVSCCGSSMTLVTLRYRAPDICCSPFGLRCWEGFWWVNSCVFLNSLNLKSFEFIRNLLNSYEILKSFDEILISEILWILLKSFEFVRNHESKEFMRNQKNSVKSYEIEWKFENPLNSYEIFEFIRNKYKHKKI